jgi:ABC-type multidrug transport system permease subunit
MFHNTSLFELIWTLMAIAGQCFYAVLGWYAFGDRRYLVRPSPGVTERRALTSRQIIATQNISVSLMLGGIETSLMLGGILSMFIPPSSPSATRSLTTTGIVLLLSLFMVHVFLIAVAIVLFVSRTRLLAKVEADREFLAALRQHAGIEGREHE